MRNIQHQRETWECEELALKLLKKLPFFANVDLLHLEKPDLQTKNKSWGIEVVRAISTDYAETISLFDKGKFSFASGKLPKETRNTIPKYEETRETFTSGNSFPCEVESYSSLLTITSKHPSLSYQVTIDCIKKKQKKYQDGNYDGFTKLGLFVFTEVPEEGKDFLLHCVQDQNPFDAIFFSDGYRIWYTMMSK